MHDSTHSFSDTHMHTHAGWALESWGIKASVLQLVSFFPHRSHSFKEGVYAHPKTWEVLPLKVRLAEIMSPSLSWSFLLCISTCYDMTLQLWRAFRWHNTACLTASDTVGADVLWQHCKRFSDLNLTTSLPIHLIKCVFSVQSTCWLLFGEHCWPSVDILHPDILLSSWFSRDGVQFFHGLIIYLKRTMRNCDGRLKRKNLFVISRTAGEEDCSSSLVLQLGRRHQTLI